MLIKKHLVSTTSPNDEQGHYYSILESVQFQ